MFDFEAWGKEARPIVLTADAALHEVLAMDTAHQTREAEAGGTISSNLTDEGQEAAERIVRHRENQLAAVHSPRLSKMDAAHSAPRPGRAEHRRSVRREAGRSHRHGQLSRRKEDGHENCPGG